MAAGEIVERAVELQALVVVGVGVAEPVAAGDEVHAARDQSIERRAGNARRVEIVELQCADALGPAVLAARERLEIGAQGGRDAIAPVGEEPYRVGSEIHWHVDPRGSQPIGGDRRSRLPAALIRERSPVRLARVPVELGERAFRALRRG